jgi:diaminopimelate decarboxylase
MSESLSRLSFRPALLAPSAQGTAIAYRQGVLSIEDLPIPELAAHIPTPFYAYADQAITANYTRYKTAFKGAAKICYAVKANANQAVLTRLARLGAGADVVSLGEIERALAAGFSPQDIVFSGVGKTRQELTAALTYNIHQINVESLAELELLSTIATELKVAARIGLRLNPDVDARTHAKITTGRRENKFGIDWGQAREAFWRANSLPGLKPVAIALHIGSQLTDLTPYRDAYRKLAELVRLLRQDGIAIDTLDLGGGIGVSYRDEIPIDLESYAAMITQLLGELDCRWVLEPGRSLIADAGVLVTRVLYVKAGVSKNFIILDAGMNDLLRPTLYEAYMPIKPVIMPENDAHWATFDLVGPVCESGDYLGLERQLATPKVGDLLAVTMAGAYGAVMASNYNSRPLLAEIMVKGSRFAVIRQAQTISALIAQDHLPPWLEE